MPVKKTPEGGTVTITARLRDSETAPADKAPFHSDGLAQAYAIDIGTAG